MIRKNGVWLFTKQENYVTIVTTLGKRGKIKTYWYAVDKKCAIENSKKWRKNNKKRAHESNIARYKVKHAILSRLKINGCAVCGYNKYGGALEFHHVNPEDKKFPLSTDYMCRSSKEIINELNKCILLCANCHKEIHRRK